MKWSVKRKSETKRETRNEKRNETRNETKRETKRNENERRYGPLKSEGELFTLLDLCFLILAQGSMLIFSVSFLICT